ncbi:MAG: hypothetical protein ACLUZ4_03795 [Christensenellaceae bacterium]
MPYDSPISNSGVLFYNTLFDETPPATLLSAIPMPASGRRQNDQRRAQGTWTERQHDPC